LTTVYISEGFSSPSFPIQELRDKIGDNTKNGSPDILSVRYSSDGRFLNVTIWLNSISSYTRGSYGVYIDADFYNATGYRGADYNAYTTYVDKVGKFIIEEFETTNPQAEKTGRHLHKIFNYNLTYNNLPFIKLVLDLKEVGMPEKYRIAFFAQNLIDNKWEGDFTKWISIPAPEVAIIPSENPVFIRKGESKNLEIGLKVSEGFFSYINMINNTDINNTEISSKLFKGLNLTYSPDRFSISKYGTSTFMAIYVPDSSHSKLGPNTIPIVVNFTNPTSQFKVESMSLGKENAASYDNYHSSLVPTSKDVITYEAYSSLTVVVEPPLGINDHLKNFVEWLSPINSVWTFLVAVGTVLISIIIRMNKKRTKEK
jgi:hypothetical protein